MARPLTLVLSVRAKCRTSCKDSTRSSKAVNTFFFLDIFVLAVPPFRLLSSHNNTTRTHQMDFYFVINARSAKVKNMLSNTFHFAVWYFFNGTFSESWNDVSFNVFMLALDSFNSPTRRRWKDCPNFFASCLSLQWRRKMRGSIDHGSLDG